MKSNSMASGSPGNSSRQASFESQPGAILQGHCWALTEGAAGMMSQVRGLAQAIGLPYELKTIEMRLPWKKLWPGIIPIHNGMFPNQDWRRCDVPPRLVISCGRQGMMGALLLKKELGDRVYTVHLQDPKINSRRFDLVVAPEHDGAKGTNVLCTKGALHPVTPAVLQAAANSTAAAGLSGLRPGFVAVLLGGPNKCYDFSVGSLEKLVEQLKAMVQTHDVDLVVLPSRRTPEDVRQQFLQAFGDRHCVWTGATENPYMAALALCSQAVVTGDSVSMISEAASTEKPVHVFHLPERRVSKRFRRFHQEFAACGITRPFVGRLDQWTYRSPNPTQQIADFVIEQLVEQDQSHSLPVR
ncbi:mitochondrial fission ELM1 family protein [Planctomicrobium sp. SH527]|uniref:mitochondrial fission ELM1 family protein n=1 Tax=Planctomicrobium sp. SH527 TaxID=3448123 RepID=UPI003F5B9C04